MYDSCQLFSTFLKEGTLAVYENDIEFYTFSLDANSFECKDFETIRKALLEVNSSSNLRLDDGVFSLEFEAGTEHWQPDFKSFFHKDIESFLRACIRRRSVPNQYCILDRKLSESDATNPILTKISIISRWAKLLDDMADHTQDNGIFVFFVHSKQGKAKPYEISPFIKYQDLDSLEFDCDDKRYNHLHDSWHLNDAHEKDRQSVMLVSFAEIMSSLKDGENPFVAFLANTKKFHDRYCENYDIYVNRFTVDGQLREIDEQHLSFVGKLQDLVSSSQTKAFAIPSVMVAIGAFAKTDNILGVVSIIIGVIMTKALINKSNELIKENLEHSKDTFDRALGQYVKSRQEVEEVSDHAKTAQSKLHTQLDNAKLSIDFIDKMSNRMLFIGFAIAFVMLLSILKNAYPLEFLSIIEFVKENGKSVIDWLAIQGHELESLRIQIWDSNFFYFIRN